MSQQDLIKHYMKDHHLTLDDLAQKTGRKRGYLRRVLYSPDLWNRKLEYEFITAFPDIFLSSDVTVVTNTSPKDRGAE